MSDTAATPPWSCSLVKESLSPADRELVEDRESTLLPEANNAGTVIPVGSSGDGQPHGLCTADLSRQLPALPPSVLELNRILSSDPVDLNQLSQACASDPSLAARIVGLSNSSLFSLAQPVSSVEQAVMMVGADYLRTLALACYLVEGIGHRLPSDVEQHFWQRAFLTAALSQRIAQWTRYPDSAMAYFAGLLHDIGILPLLISASSVGADPISVEAHAESTEAQRALFGTDHCELGRSIGDQWDFPAPLVAVFEFHEEPQRTRTQVQLVRIVAAAAKLAHALGAGGAGPSPNDGRRDPASSQQLLGACLPGVDSELLRNLAEVLQMDYQHVDRWLETHFLKSFPESSRRH
jgi:HD-like signal output (HDOD) protein